MNDHEIPAPAARPRNRAEKMEELREALEHLRERQQARANGDFPPSPGPRKKMDSVFFAKPGLAGNEKEPANDRNETAGSDISCHVCGDKRIVTRNVPLDHPAFGRAFVCPACQGGPDRKRRQKANVTAYFGEHWLWNSAKLVQHTLDDFYFLDEDLAVGKGWSITAAQRWACEELLTYDTLGMVEPTVTPFEPSPALVISGPSGLGKTCLASAAFVARVGHEGGLPIEYNALMRAVLRQMDLPDGKPDAAVMIAAGAGDGGEVLRGSKIDGNSGEDEMNTMDDHIPDLGRCCACGKRGPDVRNVMMLNKKAPVSGQGWGCFVCGLPADGAVAVVCDGCLDSEADIRWACVGYPGEDKRIDVDSLAEPFEHDLLRHEIAPELIGVPDNVPDLSDLRQKILAAITSTLRRKHERP